MTAFGIFLELKIVLVAMGALAGYRVSASGEWLQH